MSSEAVEQQSGPAAKRQGFGIAVSIFLTLVATIIGFFTGMALSIAGVALVAAIRGAHPEFSLTYRYFAPPVALLFFVGSIAYFARHRG